MMSGTKIAASVTLAAALAACSAGGGKVKNLPPPPAKASASETDTIFTLLMQGDEGAASKRLKALLKREPMNATARLLSDSITRDPKDLLGPQSHPYTVEAGDTVAGLATRFLGNRLKAYQLLRYNALKAPATLMAGQVLRIPGEAPRAEPAPRLEPAPTRSSSAPAAPSKPRTAAPKPTAPAPAAASNPAAARQARAAGLAALNQGNVDRAVGLLHRAATLDPGNPVIARDLARAQRIAATVKAHR